MRVIVVGAGIMGLASAWALKHRGHDVTVLDRGDIPNPRGSSADQHRHIRYAYGAKHGYARMIAGAYAAWEAMWSDLGRSYYVPTDGVSLLRADLPWRRETTASLQLLGMPARELAQDEIARRFPMFDLDGVIGAVESHHSGVLLADQIVAALAAHLDSIGVELRPRVEVRDVDPDLARVRIDGATLSGDAVAVAAGAWTGRLLPHLAPTLVPCRQLLIYVEPPAALAAAWAAAPVVVDRRADSALYAVPPVAGTSLKLADHAFSGPGDPDDDRAARDAERDGLLALLRRSLRGFDRYRVVATRACYYTLAPEERFVLAPLGRAAWAISACSGHGFKFGALMGQGMADAIEGRRPSEALTDWAAGREREDELAQALEGSA